MNTIKILMIAIISAFTLMGCGGGASETALVTPTNPTDNSGNNPTDNSGKLIIDNGRGIINSQYTGKPK